MVGSAGDMKTIAILVAATAVSIILLPFPSDAFCVFNDGSQCVTRFTDHCPRKISPGILPSTEHLYQSHFLRNLKTRHVRVFYISMY